MQRGDTAAALPLYERALAIWEANSGPDSADVAHTLTDIAVIHLEQVHRQWLGGWEGGWAAGKAAGRLGGGWTGSWLDGWLTGRLAGTHAIGTALLHAPQAAWCVCHAASLQALPC